MESQWKNTRNYFRMIEKRLENAQDVAIRFMWEIEIIIAQEVITISRYGKITDFLKAREKLLMKQLSGSCCMIFQIFNWISVFILWLKRQKSVRHFHYRT